MDDPLVSVIIPTYNRQEYICSAIDSVLKQDYSNIEIVVSDNHSTDATMEILKNYAIYPKVRIFRNNSNIGMVANWHKCLYEYVKGEYFIIVSDDDYLIMSSYISDVMRIISIRSDIFLAYSSGYILNEDNNELIELKLNEYGVLDGIDVIEHWGGNKQMDAILCNIVFNSELSRKLNAFRDNDNICADSKLFLDLCTQGKVLSLDKKASVYRIHSRNLLKQISTNYNYALANIETYTSPYNYLITHDKAREANLEDYFRNCILPTIANAIYSLSFAQRSCRKMLIKKFFIDNNSIIIHFILKKNIIIRLHYFMLRKMNGLLRFLIYTKELCAMPYRCLSNYDHRSIKKLLK